MVRWLIGSLIGTVIVWGTSPLLVRSYLPKTWDQTRQRWVLQPGGHYRWRSEGYAMSRIGAHGMVGREMVLSQGATSRLRLALWGDSQAEGVSVADREKLFAAMESALPDVAVMPLAASGTDALDWTEQFGRVEEAWSLNAHVVLLCELVDLDSLNEADAPGQAEPPAANRWLPWVPDFAVHAMRGLALDPQTDQLRRLRFRMGPIAPPVVPTAATLPDTAIDFAVAVDALAAATKLPIWILYAPRVPYVLNDKIVRADEQAGLYASFVDAVERSPHAARLHLVDCRPALLSFATDERFPHGFHNGQIGNGHLNADGYRVIANALAEVFHAPSADAPTTDR